jgi:hypothetical protein
MKKSTRKSSAVAPEGRDLVRFFCPYISRYRLYGVDLVQSFVWLPRKLRGSEKKLKLNNFVNYLGLKAEFGCQSFLYFT